MPGSLIAYVARRLTLNPRNPHPSATIKVIVVGNGRVGKSSMTTRCTCLKPQKSCAGHCSFTIPPFSDCKNVYTDTYKKTIGVDFMEKVGCRRCRWVAGLLRAPSVSPPLCAGQTIELDEFGEAVRLMIWDTAGQEEFDSLTSRYYKGAGCAVLVFSTVDRDSFDALESWKRKVEDECGPIAMALVQNKIDLMDQAVMTRWVSGV